MTRSTILHKYITLMKLHVKLELFFQQVKIVLPIHGSFSRQKEEAGVSFCRHASHTMMLGGCLTVCWVYRSSNRFPGGLLTVILRVPNCWIVDSSEKTTFAHCSSLHVTCFFANCNRLVFMAAVSRGFLAGLCYFKLNCLTRRRLLVLV